MNLSHWKGRVDWPLALSALGLVAVGSVAIFSAASPLPHYPQILKRHFMALGLGVLAFAFGIGFNYQIFRDQSKFLYSVVLLMMVAVLLWGTSFRGSKAWFQLPHFAFQPAELARLLTILVLASYLDSRILQIRSLGTVLGAVALLAPILGLLMLEPDFSSTLVFLPILISMLFCAGAHPWHLLVLGGYVSLVLGFLLGWIYFGLRPEWEQTNILVGYFLQLSGWNWVTLLTFLAVLLAALLVWRLCLWVRLDLHWIYSVTTALLLIAAMGTAAMIHHGIKGYQRNRLVAFLAPESHLLGAAYNVQQAQIAIGSGGFWGKGIFSGTQSQLGFLPERHTDFIFAVVGEEMGFLGSMAVLGLYLVLLWRVIHAARLSRDRYGFLVCAGFCSMFGFYLLANAGMCVGWAPVAGIPLLLVSYGGSSLVVSLCALGIVSSVYARRYTFL